ncbi:MAG: uroporphyrinogen decarboxylase family protein [Saccharofermentanales bacterium]
MNSKERVMQALAHKKTDRLPANYTASYSVTERLMKHFGVADEHELLCALNVDMRRVPFSQYQGCTEPDSDGFIANMWGVKTRKAFDEYYGGEAIYPFGDDSTVEDIHNHNWPDASKCDYSQINDFCKKYSGEYAIFGSPWAEFFHTIGWTIGQENYFIYMYTKPEVIDAITFHIVDYYAQCLVRYLEAADGMNDITYFGNDFGTQRGLFISPEQYDRFIRKYYKRLFDISHEFGCKVMIHSCGAIRQLIPAFIEDGVDIIDPLQITADGMDFDGLYRDFSSKICLHGGIDMQYNLILGSPADVRTEVRSRIETSHENGGYILCPSQSLIDEVPIENILAMYDENARN